MRRITTFVLAAFVLSIAAPALSAGPFTDVPKGHWAYKAIDRAVESGILQGYDGRFHGNKSMNRYQIAVIVARMLDRIETMGPGGGKLGKKDIENLEALTVEFADELALLNVKVATLEEGFSELKRDVDSLKHEFAHGGARAGISGMLQGRFALTDDDPNAVLGRGPAAVAMVAGTGGAATHPVARYVGTAPAGAGAAGNAVAGESRTFFNIAQTSIGFDRHYDEDYYIHMQLDIDADNESTFVGGNSIQVNEAYVDLEKWLMDGDVRLRAGAWALPFDRERNPEMAEYANQLRYGFRTLDLTISPTLAGQSWEKIRNVGVGAWNGKDSGFQWQVGATTTPSSASAEDGSVLAWRQAALNGGAGRFGRFGGAFTQAGSANNASLFGDAQQSIDNNNTGGSIASNIGFYGWVGDKYDSGLRWDLGYFSNGGNLAPAADEVGTGAEYDGFQFNAGYWGWENWGFMASYYSSTSDSLNAGGGAGGAFGAAGYMVNNTPLAPALPAGSAYPDMDSEAWSVLVNYQFNDDHNVSVRYEDASDDFGPASISATVLTFDWNYRMSANSLLQLEYSTPETENRAAVLNAAGTGYAAGAANTVDVNDDLMTINYKVRF